MEQFDTIIPYVLGHEGVTRDNPTGYVHDPSDPGGETKFGISQKAWDRLAPDFPLFPKSVKDLTKEEAIEVYHKEYYSYVFEKLPLGPALVCLDCEVNRGNGIIILQRALDTSDWGSWSNTDDLQLKLAIRDVPKFIEDLSWKRVEDYGNLVHKNPKLLVYIHGWLNRVVLCRSEALKL